MVKHMVDINAVVQRILADAVMTAHEGDVVVSEDDRSDKLILIGLTLSVEYVVAEDVVHRMSIALEEERIDS